MQEMHLKLNDSNNLYKKGPQTIANYDLLKYLKQNNWSSFRKKQEFAWGTVHKKYT